MDNDLIELSEDTPLDVLERATWYPGRKPAGYVNLAIDLLKVRIKKFRFIPSSSGKVYAFDIMPFGKYKGNPFTTLPTYYIGWMLENAGGEKRVLNALLKEMLSRIEEKEYVYVSNTDDITAETDELFKSL
jgi:uncharacterized protein (DUF3820 family)